MNWKVILIFIVVVDIFIPFILGLLDIDNKYYLNYLLWVNALLILYIILPNNSGDVFMD